jgi:septum site-determining protein MinC
MPDPLRPSRSIRAHARSYSVLALTPEPPILGWLADLDAWIGRSPGFFVGKPMVLDLSAIALSKAAVSHLVQELQTRDIRLIGIEGVDPSQLGPELPPPLTGGRATGAIVPSDPPVPLSEQVQQEPASLLLESVRSGQSIFFPQGDITVLGAVASGADVIAGGSIHVYGTLRGRAMAGSNGNPRARIFCSKLEAELLAIGGFYRTADEVEVSLRSQPIQAWLKDEEMFIAPLD